MKNNIITLSIVALLTASCTGAGGLGVGANTAQKIAISKAGDSQMSCSDISSELSEVDEVVTLNTPSIAGDAAIAVASQAALQSGAIGGALNNVPGLGAAVNIFNQSRNTNKQLKAEVLQSAQQRKLVLDALKSNKGC